MGLVSVFGNDVDAYYEKLLAGESGITPIDRFDASKFPTRFGGQIRGFKSEGYIDGKNDRRLDDCLRYCIVAGKKALEDADLGGDRLGKVMESLEHAMKRDAPIIAEYLGGAVNCDAYHMTDPRADGLGVSSCIQSALEDAGVSPEESMIGHCLGAAGGLEAIATVKGITTGWLHPTINQFNPEPSVEFDTVANKKQQHEVNVAISNSFGFGGHNSVVAFSAFKP
ncbi:UNVERIFIED_CONTAM: 3-oxoacyl-[acyl-carrier-protein] synthase I, chloroplastic [Sesamum angustifolium]|uniref:beta-ketoacyl-[acyl-carrier-protein] synthase I n=1 Tax=Sesamum angustifolium TaxID=2727405 RepID=A0AAW2PBB1_9LAMI